jgi:tetratricopeptide (TPR) repeat protein
VLTGLSLVLIKCSVEKNTETSRFYNGMTARFNIYFNGYESFKAGVAKVISRYQDDYTDFLRVFEYSDASSASLCSSDMERAIQKASKLISLKSITAKPDLNNKRQLSEKEKDLLDRKEYNEWVDDSYFLIGKARFYKHEYNEAASVLNYCITEANDLLIKKEASIWLARINAETGNYTESLRLIRELELTPDLPGYIVFMYHSTQADLFMKQKRYSEAIDPLIKSIESASGKKSRYRLTYLLAQVYEQTGDAFRARTMYEKVVRMNPPYDVEFNARINIAGVFDVNAGNPVEIRRELEKMLRDSKNKEFQDQIYFAIGNLAMKEGNEKEAVEYFTKSAAVNAGNRSQKAKSYLSLAEYFNKKPDYLMAARYYDSTVYSIDQNNPNYQALKIKSLNYDALVAQLTVIQREDSLQKIAKMSESERNTMITSIINKAIKEETEGKTNRSADRYNMGQFYENERRFQGNIEQEGKWYFYNQAALTFGRTEFRRRWGDRKLEDNWRRSNKARVSTGLAAGGTDESARSSSDTSKAVRDFRKPEFYLKNLPLNDSLMNISNEKIANALLNAGKVYSENFHDQAKATETFESLISRYPSHELIREAMYNVYLINRDINAPKSELSRQRLLEKYPGSEFAMILSDPDYYKKKIADLQMAETIYKQAYNLFATEKFNDAISLCDDALKTYQKNQLAPKFQLLRAYSVARISDERTFRNELNTLIKTYPKTAESSKAEELIAYLNQKTPELKVEEDKEIAKELFVADTTANHVFALIITDPSFNINLATFDVISYNIDNFTNNNYKTEQSLIGNKFIMITVSGFRHFREALGYYNGFSAEKLVRNPSGARMMTFLISKENLKVMNNDKNPDRYQLFFRENYLK